MTQQELEISEMVDTPLGRVSMASIVAALQQYHNPTTTIALLLRGIEDVLSRRESLTDEQALEVLLACGYRHGAEIGVNWDVIDYWINELFGDES
jgi:riboflavin synthase